MLYNKLIFIYCVFAFISIIHGLPRPTANAGTTKAQTMRLALAKRSCNVSSGEFACKDTVGVIQTYICCKADEICKTRKKNGKHFCGEKSVYGM
ncbi:hypothetical protein BJ944DRAFT_266626 [Cunninghamella echinulata]|nr:hypothetical protein BJ944DRAFT_266626 [Cunninghamella echinulata]